jgi:sugar/nucleoside kinase (ribokinase family)
MVLTKAAMKDKAAVTARKRASSDWIILPSAHSTSIRNIYHSPDRERREVSLLSQAAPFTIDEIPQNPAKIIYFAGLFKGEIPETLIAPLSEKGKIALDAQGLVRQNHNGSLLGGEWPDARRYLPMITYFKADAAEAEILTGRSDRKSAAQILSDWGAKEVLLTHNSEVLVASGGKMYQAPYTNRNCSGRTGRGDTTFGAYLAWRLDHSIQESVEFSAALCSIKMEQPGPFQGDLTTVFKRIEGK